MNIETQAPIGEPLVSVTSNLEWACDDALVYVTMDNILRPDKVGILLSTQYLIVQI
jgi:oligopeptidase B